MSYCHQYLDKECVGCPNYNGLASCANHQEQYKRDLRAEEIEKVLDEYGLPWKKTVHGYLFGPKCWTITPNYKWKTYKGTVWYRVKDARTLIEKYYLSKS